MKRKDRSSNSANEERKSKKTKKISDAEEIQQVSKLDFSSAENLLSSLIAPTSSETFFSEYWEKKPLVIHREDTAFYGPLFTKANLEAILKKEELEFVNDVNVCRYEDGDKLYMNGDIGTRATFAQVSKDIKERQATVQFHQPQRFKEIIWKLNGHLESIFGCLVGANVYITPPDSQGLAPHHDDVEIFILQLEGKKQWKLYKPPTELPQEYSPDLEQDEIGQPTHEFELQPGDMVYFPRGTVHQAVTPKGEGHSTHITLSTYQQNAWGNLLTSVISDAIDKALEADVEFRRGLPVNFLSYMGLGMEGDGKVKSKQEDFNNQIKQLLSRLVGHIDCHDSVDKLAVDFMANRLPPIEQKEEAMKGAKDDSEKPPTEDSEVKLRYPEHVRVSVGNAADIAVGVADDDESDDEDGEGMSEEDGSQEDDEQMEESEGESKPKKGKKPRNKSENQAKQDKTKSKGKKKEKDDEEDDDSGDEKSKGKKKKPKKEPAKSKKSSSKKGTKKEGSEEEDEKEGEMEDEKPKTKTSKAKKVAQSKKKGKKGTSESEDDDDDDDASFVLGDEDTEESSDEEDESDEEGEEGPWVFVHHSLNNDPSTHMMGPEQPSIIKFPLTFKDALLHLYRERHDFIPLKSLPLDEKDNMYLVTSLWSEGLIAVKE